MALYSANRTRRSLIDTIALRALSQIATMLGYIVFVRGMPKADFGLFNLLYSFIPVLGTIASFGLEQVLRRYQPEYLRLGNVSGAVSLVRFIASARFALNIIFIGVLLLTWNLLAPIFHLGPYRLQFAWFSLIVILYFQVQILALSLASHMLHRFSVGAIALLSIARLMGYLVMLHYAAFSLNHAIVVDTAAYAIVYIFMRTIYLRRCAPAHDAPAYKIPAEERKRMFRYGLFNNFNDVGTLLLGGSTDNFFIAAFIDPISVGIYAFYGRLNDMAMNLLPIRLFDNIIQPLFFSVTPADADRRLKQIVTLLLDINMVWLWPVLTYSLVYHGDIVHVFFGGKYSEYSRILPLFVFFSTVNSVAVPITLAAQYDEKAGIILLSKVFVAYNLVAMIVLLPLVGLYGAILARGSAEAFKNLFIWWSVRQHARWMNFRAVIGYALLVWTPVIAICLLLKRLSVVPPVLQLFIGGLACAIGLLIYVRTPAIANSDRLILGSVFHGKEVRIMRRLGLIAPDAAALPPA
ncbi:MAG: lipopolysaccharide biosynthesis protein [Steroidobacteraceae bacterium]|jgi:O-antigen/teichoic acid export membrane protein